MNPRSSRFDRFVLATLVAVAIVAPWAATQPVVALSDSGEFEFAGGQSLTWDGEWELDDALTYTDGELESVTLTLGVSLFSVLGLPNDFDLNEARDIYLDSLLEEVGGATTIDRGSYGRVSYSLDLVTIEGLDFGVFTLFRAGSGSTPTFAYIFFSEETAFASQFASARAAFRLDGGPIYDGVDGAGLQAQLEAVDSDAQETTDDTGTAAEETVDETSVDPGDEDASGEGTGGLKIGRDDAAGADDSDEGNTQTEAAYVSPQFGTELDWGSSWELDPEADPPMTSDTASGVDSVALVPVDGAGFLTVAIIDAGSISEDSFYNLRQFDDVFPKAPSSDAELVMADASPDVSAIVWRDYREDGSELVVVRELRRAGDEAVVVVQLSVTPQNLDAILSSVQADVVFNDQQLLSYYTVKQVMDQFGS